MRYKIPRPLHVKWNRLLNSVLIIGAVFTERVELLYLFIALNLLTLSFTIHYGPTRWLLRPFEKAAARWLDVPPAYARSYAVNALTERFEVVLRILFMLAAVTFYPCCPTVTWLIAVGMGIFMLISTFFGFCLSALGFIAVRSVTERFGVR